ncbi:hypothetical protein CSKR_113455 [Clonorchis sinensis]|uniref:Uncharacterized protein n=1 Tax=Clonorchis sinensis TaxID=79923 RepID=A0A3R7C5W9_CLOSI|nr:hypothetical protein CSKR_113455 [Clonorchis sinensis]
MPEKRQKGTQQLYSEQASAERSVILATASDCAGHLCVNVHQPNDPYSFMKQWSSLRSFACYEGARWPKWLEREFTDRKLCGLNPTSASRLPLSRLGQPGSIAVFQPSCFLQVAWQLGTERVLQPHGFFCYERPSVERWLEREFTDRKFRGSNPTSVSRLPLSKLGQPGSFLAFMLPSRGMAAR